MIPRERRFNNLSEDDRIRVHLAANLASLTNYVNQAGHALIDLKPLNVLGYRKDGYVCLVDCDGFRIQSNSAVFPAAAYTPDYLAPEYQTASFRPDQCGEEQDRFALAVIIYELLDNGIHPFSGIDQANPGESFVLHARIQQQRTFLDGGSGLQPPKSSHCTFFPDDTLDLLLRAFTGPARQRPSSGEWTVHLQGLAQYRMKPCGASRDHWDYGKGCAWCLSKPVQIPPPGGDNRPRSLASPASAGSFAAAPIAYSSRPAPTGRPPSASTGRAWAGNSSLGPTGSGSLAAPLVACVKGSDMADLKFLFESAGFGITGWYYVSGEMVKAGEKVGIVQRKDKIVASLLSPHTGRFKQLSDKFTDGPLFEVEYYDAAEPEEWPFRELVDLAEALVTSFRMQKRQANIAAVSFALVAGLCLFMASIDISPTQCILIMLGSIAISIFMVVKSVAVGQILTKFGVN